MHWNHCRRLTRQAFTLLEMAAVIAILAVLSILILPAVQASRESARALRCSANLRQLGLACGNYEQLHGMFPPGQMLTGRNYTANRMSGFCSLLPHIEQGALYSSINMSFAGIESDEYPTVDNRTARNARIDVFLCPSDGDAHHLASYRFNRGRLGVSATSTFDGPFSVGVTPTAAVITDGLSRTAFLSERIGGTYDESQTPDKRNVKLPMTAGRVRSDDDFTPKCEAAPDSIWWTTSGRYWMFNGMLNTDYNHTGVPNDRRASCGAGIDYDVGIHPPRSYHSSGVNVLFGDGHVEFVGDSIQLRVWRALGTFNAND